MRRFEDVRKTAGLFRVVWWVLLDNVECSVCRIDPYGLDCEQCGKKQESSNDVELREFYSVNGGFKR